MLKDMVWLCKSIYLEFKQMAWPRLWRPNAPPAPPVALPLNPGIRKESEAWETRIPGRSGNGNDDTTPIYDPPPLEAVPKQLIYVYVYDPRPLGLGLSIGSYTALPREKGCSP